MASDVKWIKITTDIFDDEKILLIESLPDSYAIITVWFKLLCLAGKQNNSGVFMMGRIAYTDKMLATIFRMKETTVTMALQTFQQFGMVEIVDGVITIPNWGKHQSLDAYEKRKERDRIYQAERRAAQRALAEVNKSADSSSNTSSDIAPLDKDIEEEKELDNKKDSITCQQIVDLYHSICTSFPSVRSLSDARKKAIKARLKKYTLDDFRQVFENAEASSFLKGADGGWKASFDWLIKEANMLKVLEGNYADKPQRFARQEKKPNWMQPSMELGEAEMEAIHKMMGTKPTTVETDPIFAEEAAAMQKRLQEKYGRKEA
jgi:predicted phage replisome organizer